MPVTKLEKWVAPRAFPLLAVIAVLTVGVGTALYFVRHNDLERVTRLERVIRCQDSMGCRDFIERAIRDVLKEKGVKVDKKHGVSLRIEEANGTAQGVIAIGGAEIPVPIPLPQAAIGPSKPLKPPEGTRTPKEPPLPRTAPPSSPEAVSNARPVAVGGPPTVEVELPPTGPPACVRVGDLVETC